MSASKYVKGALLAGGLVASALPATAQAYGCYGCYYNCEEEEPDYTAQQAEIEALAAEIGQEAFNRFVVDTVGLSITDRLTKLRALAAAGAAQTAGENWADHMKNVQFTLNASYADISDDQLGGDGYNADTSLYMTASFDDLTIYGMGLTYDRYKIDDRYDIDQYSLSVDFFVSRTVWRNLSVGGYVNYAYAHLAEATITNGPVSTQIGGSDHLFGAGVMVNDWEQYKGYTFSMTSTLASLNNSDLGSFLDSEDTVFINTLEVSHNIYDKLDGAVHTTWFYNFDNNGNSRDTSYGIVGGDLTYSFGEKVHMSVGYERTVFYDAFEDNRINASLTYDW